jgi:mediator of RNA polymerase II transcription subunit 14
MRDTGDLAAAGRGPKFSTISEAINMNPIMLPEALVGLRFSVRSLISTAVLALINISW